MNFILYSAVSAENISSHLGKPEYSYYFVLKKFAPIFEQLGDVIYLHSFREIDNYINKGFKENTLLICFSPPNKSYISKNIKVINIFAWEFNNIPYESWADDIMQNWVDVLSHHVGAITLSTHSSDVVKTMMFDDYPVTAIPVPIWNDFSSLYIPQVEPLKDIEGISIDGSIIDSAYYDATEKSFDVDANKLQLKRTIPSDIVELSFDVNSWSAGYIGGFYEPEEWGSWTKHTTSWILMPYIIRGEVKLEIEVNAYCENIGRNISITLGDQTQIFQPSVDSAVFTFDFDLSEPAKLITFSNLNVDVVKGAADERSMGIGLHKISLDFSNAIKPTDIETKNILSLSGVVYTTVFNPDDDRKNWQDIVKAFCYAFFDTADATLVLKITHHSLGSFLGQFHYLLASLGKFNCRVVVLHGYLDKTSFQQLVNATTYYVNASKCEGLCMPLMEFMAAGKPAIATNNTAMADYFSSKNGFVVESHEEPAIWPHDERMLNRTTKFRINWESLVLSFSQSYTVAKNNHPNYWQLSECAFNAIKNFASNDNVYNEMKNFIADVCGEQ